MLPARFNLDRPFSGKALALTLAAVLLVSGLSAYGFGLPYPGFEKTWIPSPYPSGMCTLGGVCAEWVEQGQVEWTCCLDPDLLFTTDFYACSDPRRPQI